MRNLIWESEAERLFLSTVEYIASQNAAVAVTLESSILRQVNMLPRFRELGRIGRVTGTRELVVHSNYLIVYHFDDRAVRILRFLHARRQYP